MTIKGHSQSALRHGLCTGKVDCHFTANNTKYLCTGKASGGHGVRQAYYHDCEATSPETATKAHMWTPTGSTYGCYFGCSICQQDFVEHRPYNFKYYNYCYDPSFKQINQACTKELSSLSNFHTLLIGDSKLTNDDLAFENLGGAISKFTKLTHLDLQNNNLHTIDVDSLEKVYRPIVERYVDKDEVRNDNVSVSLGGNPLVLFKLNGLRKKYAKGWLAVFGNCTTINKIDVQNSGWTGHETDLLFSMIPKWQGISYIDVDFGKIALVEEIPTFTGGKNIGDLGAIVLAHVLARLMVVELDLSYNNIGDNGAISLAQALPTSKVTHINLQWNNIGEEGLNALKSVCRNYNSTSTVETNCSLQYW